MRGKEKPEDESQGMADIGREYRCPLCGHRFTAKEAAACRINCPLAKGCKLVQCPNCRYEFPPG